MKTWMLRIVCILFILAGLAGFVGVLIATKGIAHYADPSPMLAVQGLSVVSIVLAGKHLYKIHTEQFNGAGAEPTLPKVGRPVLWAFRTLGVLSALAGLAFIVKLLSLVTEYYSFELKNIILLSFMAVAAVLAAVWSLEIRAPFSSQGTVSAKGCASMAVALILTAALGFVYVRYLPKYSLLDGMNIARADTAYANKKIYSEMLGISSYTLDGNPFLTESYAYNCDSFAYDSGGFRREQGFILFDAATGLYRYQKYKDKLINPQDRPAFSWNGIMYDDGGQRKMILNLYFEETFEGNLTNPGVSPGSADWDKYMKDIKGSPCFPEDQARAFLRDAGEAWITTGILDCINTLDNPPIEPRVKDMTIEVLFFGIDIATYQNGEVALKQQ